MAGARSTPCVVMHLSLQKSCDGVSLHGHVIVGGDLHSARRTAAARYVTCQHSLCVSECTIIPRGGSTGSQAGCNLLSAGLHS